MRKCLGFSLSDEGRRSKIYQFLIFLFILENLNRGREVYHCMGSQKRVEVADIDIISKFCWPEG